MRYTVPPEIAVDCPACCGRRELVTRATIVGSQLLGAHLAHDCNCIPLVARVPSRTIYKPSLVSPEDAVQEKSVTLSHSNFEHDGGIR